ncbi:MAG TPA: hypothetical protein VF651_07040 [Gammaproteobacteria bacterium]
MSKLERHVVFIPGKNPKPAASVHREVLWRCITVGARGAEEGSAGDLAALHERFHIAGWNRMYYGNDADIGLDLPWVAEMLVGVPLPPETWRARWRRRRVRFSYGLGDRFPWLVSLFADQDARHTMEETRRYFEDEGGIATRIRSHVKEVLRPLLAAGHRVLVVGHSLGSVIAYDALWELSWQEGEPWRVDLLTLGSPLGMFYVQGRLRGHDQAGARRYPTNVLHWTNVSADGDLTALDRGLADDFRPMQELGSGPAIVDYTHGVHTSFRTAAGHNPHRCYGYFFNPLVARMITGWMRGEPRWDDGAA